VAIDSRDMLPRLKFQLSSSFCATNVPLRFVEHLSKTKVELTSLLPIVQLILPLLCHIGLTLLLKQALEQGILKGEYHCTVYLLFDWFGISCMTTDDFFF
jgi:hypothetical protein